MEQQERISIFVMAFAADRRQLSADWMGGLMQKNFKEAADKMAAAGSIKALDPDYQAG